MKRKKKKAKKPRKKAQGQKRERDTSEGIDLMLFHMSCPLGWGDA